MKGSNGQREHLYGDLTRSHVSLNLFLVDFPRFIGIVRVTRLPNHVSLRADLSSLQSTFRLAFDAVDCSVQARATPYSRDRNLARSVAIFRQFLRVSSYPSLPSYYRDWPHLLLLHPRVPSLPTGHHPLSLSHPSLSLTLSPSSSLHFPPSLSTVL
jgi:hypothetical protein